MEPLAEAKSLVPDYFVGAATRKKPPPAKRATPYDLGTTTMGDRVSKNTTEPKAKATDKIVQRLMREPRTQNETSTQGGVVFEMNDSEDAMSIDIDRNTPRTEKPLPPPQEPLPPNPRTNLPSKTPGIQEPTQTYQSPYPPTDLSQPPTLLQAGEDHVTGHGKEQDEPLYMRGARNDDNSTEEVIEEIEIPRTKRPQEPHLAVPESCRLGKQPEPSISRPGPRSVNQPGPSANRPELRRINRPEPNTGSVAEQPFYVDDPNWASRLQRKIVPTNGKDETGPSSTYTGPKESVPINMAKGKNRFEVNNFLDFPVTMTMWQLLDRSPQIRAQLARAMASSKPSKRGRKIAAVVPMPRPPRIETLAYEDLDSDVVCLYIEVWIGDYAISKTLVDSGSVVELINRNVVDQLKLKVYDMPETWTLQLADDGYTTVSQYVWAPVNVKGVETIVKAYILGDGLVYDLLLSKRWMHRVRAIEDHGNSTLTIEGRDSIRREVSGIEALTKAVEVVGGPSVDEWETHLAEEELAHLAEEMDHADYATNQLKDQHQ